MRYHWRTVLKDSLWVDFEIARAEKNATGSATRRATRDSGNERLILEDAIHLGGGFIEQGFGLSFAEQDAYDGLSEGGGQLVRLGMEIGRRHRLREHRLRGLVIRPRLHIVAFEVRRPDRKYSLHLMMVHVVRGIADEPHELPRHLLVRTVLVDEIRPREQRARARACLLARQCVHL